MNTLTRKSKSGDIVYCDVGYDGMIDMQPCRLMENPTEDAKLFPESETTISASVVIVGSRETFRTYIAI